MNEKNLNKAICRLSNTIQYLTWAIDAETEEERIEWTNEANKMVEYAKYWIEKSNIIPF